MWFVLILVLCASVQLNAYDSHGCRETDEVYKTCGPACEPLCGSEPKPCKEECVKGCFCQPGDIRAPGSARACIPEYLCGHSPELFGF